jgi:hypothetical protein
VADAEEADGRAERRRSRLMMSMPALPLQGSSRGTKGHEEVDDLEEGDDDDECDEDEEDEANEEASGQNDGPSSSRMETPRLSLDSMDDDEVVEKRSVVSKTSPTLTRKSSYETARAEPSPLFWDADCTLGADASNKALSTSKLSPHSPPVDGTLSGGIFSDPSMVLDRKSIVALVETSDRIGTVAQGKAAQDDELQAGDDIEDVLPAAKNLARVSDSKGRDDRGFDTNTSDSGDQRSSRGDGSKVVATPAVKVTRAYESEGLVLERRVGAGGAGGSAGRTRLNSNNLSTSDTKTRASPPPPPPSEKWRAAGLTAGGTILGGPRPGDHTLKSNNSLSLTSTPLGSPKLRPPRVGSIGHNEMYRRASRSLIDVRGMETKERVEKIVREQEEVGRKRSGRVLEKGKREEGSKERSRTDVHSSEKAERTTVADGMTSGKTVIPQENSFHPLRRRRSMPAANPPSYSALFAGLPPGLGQDVKIQPREDEGKEKLPSYTNEIFLKAIMPRKMEFSSPGVQAKDRKWRRVLCVLEGTAFRVYKCPARSAGVSAIGEWWENKVGVGDPVMDNGPSAGSSAGARSAGLNSAGRASEVGGGALAREIELARARKGGEAGEVGQPVLQINNSPAEGTPELRPRSPVPKPQVQQSALSHGVTKSALTFAVHLLKPSSTRHIRSNSEACQASEPLASSEPGRRASLNIPRGSTSGRTTPSDASASVQSHRPTISPSPSPRPGSSGNPSQSLVPVSGRLSRTSQSSGYDSKAKGKRPEQELEPDERDLVRVYTMQHAESGLGKDYIKRQHVIRVRLENEQFLLQTKNVESVILWIEVNFFDQSMIIW